MKNNLKAVILAGGKGTRLYPITYEIPKPLLPVRRKPIINYLIELFASFGVKDIFVLINRDFREEFNWWKKRYFPSSLRSSGQVPSIEFIEETEPLGTFGGLWHLKSKLKGSDFFVTNGDELKKINLKKMVDFHKKQKLAATIALVKVPNPEDYGVVVTENDLVKEFLEKPKNPSSNYINSGLYLFTNEIFKYHPSPKPLMIEKDLFPGLAKERKLAGFKFQGEWSKWTDTGTWERYESAIKNWK